MRKKRTSKLLRELMYFVVVLLLSCSNQKHNKEINKEFVKPYPHIINIKEGFNNPSQIKLSEIADSIRYIVLDKQELIGDIGGIQMTDSNIYLRKSNGFVVRFGRTGKFFNSFGSIGRGPQEYLPGSIYTTTPKDDRIHVFRSAMDSYLTYEPNGNYVETKKFILPRTMFGFSCLSDSVFLCTFYYVGSFMKDYIFNAINWSAGLFDPNGNPIQLIDHPLKNLNIPKSDIRNVVSIAPSITFFNNRIVLMPKGDTIYEVASDSIYKGYIINWEQLPHKEGNELYFRQSGSSNKSSIGTIILETHSKTYIRVYFANETYLFEYDKTTGATRSMLEDPDNLGFINDLDGGINYYPYYTNRLGDIWISSEDAFSFKEKHSAEFLNKTITINPKNTNRLKSFTTELNQDDNPVLRIVYLKKFK